MIKVYFESDVHAELVAMFRDDETYNAALPGLVAEAKHHRMYVTDSDVTEVHNGTVVESITDLLSFMGMGHIMGSDIEVQGGNAISNEFAEIDGEYEVKIIIQN